MNQGNAPASAGDEEEDLNRAIDELRGVLKEDDDDAGDAAPASPLDGLDLASNPLDEAADRPLDAMADNPLADMSESPLGDMPDMSSVEMPAASAGLPEFDQDAGGKSDSGVIMSIPVDVQIVLGSTEMQVSDLMSLRKGATVALNRRIGEPVDVVVNGRKIARGEITVLENDPSRFGIRLTEIIKNSKAS